jgi:SAM-dependent methyltransferase
MPTAAVDELGFAAPTGRERAYGFALRGARVATIRLRRAYLVDRPFWARLLSFLPPKVKRRLGLDDDTIGSRKIELGGGPFPLPGYIHVDADWRGNHLEAVARADGLPFPDGFAEEIVAIHLLEHVHPRHLADVLEEWRRVLRPGGVLQVHVPNFETLATAFLKSAPRDTWSLMSATLGMYSAPDIAGPDQIKTRADHQLLLTWPVLEMILRDNGFDDVTDVSDSVRDRHSEGWSMVMEQISLVVRATR